MASDKKQPQQLVRITSSYFCCGVIIDEQRRIVEAAPILKWTIGKRIESLQATATIKKWKVEFLT